MTSEKWAESRLVPESRSRLSCTWRQKTSNNNRKCTFGRFGQFLLRGRVLELGGGGGPGPVVRVQSLRQERTRSCDRWQVRTGVRLRLMTSCVETNLSMRFAVQVCEKIKHGTRGEVTVSAPVVSSVIVFKGLRGGRGRGRGRGRGADRRLGGGRTRQRRQRR